MTLMPDIIMSASALSVAMVILSFILLLVSLGVDGYFWEVVALSSLLTGLVAKKVESAIAMSMVT